MRFSKTLLASAFFSLSIPQTAAADEIIEFSLLKSELATSESRELLLNRMTKFADRSCRDGSVLMSKDAVRRCATDIRLQFVQAIAHEELTRLAEKRPMKTFRTASR